MLNKAIEHGKEHRKPYQGAKAITCSCRNHGSCDYCLSNRLAKYLRKEEAAEEQEKEYAENK